MAWLNSHGETDKAAQVCDALVYGGYIDWFLPSKDELNLMYENLKLYGVYGGFSVYYFWSSSEYVDEAAWDQYFGNGSQYKYYKDGYDRVRAVRAF